MLLMLSSHIYNSTVYTFDPNSPLLAPNELVSNHHVLRSCDAYIINELLRVVLVFS